MIYVIGKNGFIAKRINKFFKNKKNKIKFIGSNDIDLTKQNFKKKIIIKPNSTILFLSAITPDKGKDLITFKKNISMIINFLSQIRIENISKLIYVSSDAVYSLKDQKISDNTRANPDDLYGLMHFTREQIIKKLFNKRKLLILRPTIMYGVGDTHGSYGPNRFINQLKQNKKIKLFGKGDDVRDHLFVQDFVKIIYNFYIKKNLYGEFVVASQKSLKFIDVAKKILLKYKKPKNFIEFIKVKNKPSKRYFSNLRVKKILNLKTTNINDGLKEY